MDKINQYLKKYKNITIKAGTYELTSAMKVYSDATITCEDGVVFKRMHKGRMLQMYVAPETTGYNGTHNVKWHGGKFIANTHSADADVIVIFHCDGIELDGVTIEGCVGLHSLEINASQNVTISNCTFINQSAKEGEDFREALQIDFANYDGLSLKNAVGTSPCYDGTHCQHIQINNCNFGNCPNGIGTHTVSVEEIYHEDIKINNCSFVNMGKAAIKLVGMKDVTITNCGDAKIIINKLDTAHKLEGGKVQLPNFRYNSDIVIDNIQIK